MAAIEVFDRALCCASGVCGPQVDPVLLQFAADLEWVKAHGHSITRFNLAQDPAQFAQHPEVRRLLQQAGPECLPLVFVDSQLVSRNTYPQRPQFSQWLPNCCDSQLGNASPSPLLVLDTTCEPGSGCC
ncbi:MAG: Arsenical resistance operon trans-acting repressor ArsD [Planctomycetota bacterium]|jgi:hypothetical protein